MLSVIIPCFNEEKLIEASIAEVLKAINNCKIKIYEIIFIDDGSNDKSLAIVKKIQRKNKKIKIFINKKNFGIGYTFFKGIKHCKGKYLIQIPSDNSHPASEISKILKLTNKGYDIVTTFYSNNYERSAFRNFFTIIYTPFLNFLFGTNFPYFNGLTVYKVRDLKKLKFTNYSFSYQIEIFVYLFHKYKLKTKIIPTILKDRKKGSKAFRIKNSVLVVVSIFKIFFSSLKYRTLNFFYKRKN